MLGEAGGGGGAIHGGGSGGRCGVAELNATMASRGWTQRQRTTGLVQESEKER